MTKIFNTTKQKKYRKTLRNNATETEKLLWGFLRKKRLGVKFVRQYGIGKYIVDFYCPSKELVIEIDGSQHKKDNAVVYDKQRTEYLEEIGITVLRFSNNDIYNRIDEVCNEILKWISCDI